MKKLSLKNRKNKKKGFTLIELIIVIAIIAILAAMAIPKFGEVRQSANLKVDIASAKNIKTAAAMIIADGGKETDATDTTQLGEKIDGGFPVPKAVDGEFKVEFDDGNIIVKAGDEQVCPIPDSGIYSPGGDDTSK